MPPTTDLPNVLLLTVDALRPDHLGSYGYDRSTSPFLDRMSARGTRFPCCIAPGPNTASSVPGLLSSSFPEERDSPDRDRPEGDRRDPSGAGKVGGVHSSDGESPSLAGLLRAHGYATGAVTATPGTLAGAECARGFDRFAPSDDPSGATGGIAGRMRDFLARAIPLGRDHSAYRFARRHFRRIVGYRTAAPHLDAERIGAEATEQLADLDPPWFLWGHFMDVHLPLAPRPEAGRAIGLEWNDRTANRALRKRASARSSTFSPGEQRCLVALYDAGIRYLDERLEKLFDRLRALNALERTLVVVTADHGEEFGEHGHFDHATERSGRSIKLYDELLHVPLIVRDFTGSIELTPVPDPVSLLDLPATIARATIGTVPAGWSGRSLLSGAGDEPDRRDGENGRVVFSRQSIRRDGRTRSAVSARTRRWKLVRGPDGEPEMLFDLASDPGEETDLARRRPAPTVRLRRAAEAHLRASPSVRRSRRPFRPLSSGNASQ